MQKTLRVLALVGGLCAFLFGMLAGLGGIVAALLAGEEMRTLAVLMAASLAAQGLALGGALAWQGRQALSGRPSGPWQPRRIWIGLLILAGALATGAWAAETPPQDVLLLPVAHVLATALPPAILLALAARSLGGRVRRRDLIAQAGSGAFFSVFLAMAGETLLILGLVVLALVAVTLLPGGQEGLEGLALALETAAMQQDPGSLGEIAGSPWLWAAALGATAVAVPLVEESVKTVGVGLMLYRRPARSEAYLWGAASGAGFAIAESALNSLLGLQEWAAAVLLRIPAGLMHTFTGALMGLAWHAAFIERRRQRALALFLLCVSLHGAWNALAISSGLLDAGRRATDALAPAQASAAVLLGVLLVILAAGIGVAFIVVTRKLRPAEPLWEASPRSPTSPTAEPWAAAEEPPAPSPDDGPPAAGRE